MSNPGRKDFSTKAKEEITPDSSKSTQEKVKETITDTANRIARGVRSYGSKSTGQEAFDKTRRESDRKGCGGTAQSVGDKVKGVLGLDKE